MLSPPKSSENTLIILEFQRAAELSVAEVVYKEHEATLAIIGFTNHVASCKELMEVNEDGQVLLSLREGTEEDIIACIDALARMLREDKSFAACLREVSVLFPRHYIGPAVEDEVQDALDLLMMQVEDCIQ